MNTKPTDATSRCKRPKRHGLPPSKEITYRPQGDEREQLQYFYERGKHVLLKGPPGCGKSMLAKEFLDHLGIHYECADPGDIREARDLLGRYLIGPQGSIRVEYQLLRAARNGTPLFLDEISVLPANVLTAFNSVADGQRRLTVFGEIVTAAPGFWILGTYNPPARNFSPALRERFRFISMGYLPPAEEKRLLIDATGVSTGDAEFCVRVGMLTRTECQEIAGLGASTRTLLEAAGALFDGWPRDRVVREIIVEAIKLQDSRETTLAILRTIHAAGLFSIDEARRLELSKNHFHPETPARDDDFFEESLSRENGGKTRV